MPTLVLGVNDIPYTDSGETTTTGDVAEILEGKYGVMQHFFDLHKQEIGNLLAQQLAHGMESIALGAPITFNVYGGATSEIENKFKQFLSLREMDKLGIPGVPTKASLMGKSSRKKKSKERKGRGRSASGTTRPSFIDTGTYQANMRAEIKN